jgi:hypothetical protein
MPNKLHDALNRGDLNVLTPAFESVALGTFLVAQTGPTTNETGVVAYLDESEEVDGTVVAVFATTAGTVGAKAIVTGDQTPGVGQCKVTMDPLTGKTIITFAAADTVTVCSVDYRPTGPAYRALMEAFAG